MRRGRIIAFPALAALLAAHAPALAGRRDAAGQEFLAEARIFYRVVACGGDDPVPAGLDAATVDAHCKALAREIAPFRARYLARAVPFLARLRPPDLPRTVVYPFGGGDLLHALITYPEATEITTISLEHAGDPRRLAGLDRHQLAASLALFRDVAGKFLARHDSASDNLRRLEKGPLPGQLGLFLLALAVLDLEPVSLRFFRLRKNGTIDYLSRTEIAALESSPARRKGRSWVDTDYSVAFDNMELRFRARGGGADAPVRVHRHLCANLDDHHFAGSPLAAHLSRKGPVAAMTKAASYLLWRDQFSAIRTYLLDHMVFMISDSTGILPRDAARAGFTQTTYGRFVASYLDQEELRADDDFARLWRSQPERRLPFRYGYPDSEGHDHLVVTRPRRAP